MSDLVTWTTRATSGQILERSWPGDSAGAFERVLLKARVGSVHTWTRDDEDGVALVRVMRVGRDLAIVHVLSSRNGTVLSVLNTYCDEGATLTATPQWLIELGMSPATYKGQLLSLRDSVYIAADWIYDLRLAAAFTLTPAI